MAYSNEIYHVANQLNYKKINSVMSFLDWHWGHHAQKIPNQDELFNEACRLLEMASDDYDKTGLGYASCGGFTARCDKPLFGGKKMLSIGFYVEEADDYDNE